MLKDALRALRTAERPVLIFGAGVRLADAGREARDLAWYLGIPVAPTWGARDLFPADDPNVLCVGGFGTHGTRAANFAVQNADWILSVGSRLDSKATGTPRHYFARGADIFMVDIDPTEVRKFGGVLGKTFTGVQADAKMFLTDMRAAARADDVFGLGTLRRERWDAWRSCCRSWLNLYPAVRPEYEAAPRINPYILMRRLSEACQPGEVIVSDTGLSLAWLMQAFEFKEGQHFIHALNQTPMGYGLPAAIGAAYAEPGKRIVLVAGDGGFMLNMQELAVIARQRLPIKIILLNNDGHAMCRQTQRQWLGGRFVATSVEGGLAFPDFQDLAEAHGIPHDVLVYTADASRVLASVFGLDGPAFLEVVVEGSHALVPQVPYGRPNEDGDPQLPRDELEAQMIVEVVR